MESLQSHHVSLVQWTNLFASRHKGNRLKSPGGYLCGSGILLLALSRYIGDPNVIDHQQGFAPPTVTRPSCRQCDSPTSSHTAFLSRFPGFAAGLPSSFTTTESAAGGEPCVEPAISQDSHHVSLVQWTNLFASRHKGHRFKSPGGYLCGSGILLLALSRYITLYFDICDYRIKYTSAPSLKVNFDLNTKPLPYYEKIFRFIILAFADMCLLYDFQNKERTNQPRARIRNF